MNRIEWMIKNARDKIDDYREKYPEEAANDRWVTPRLEKQIKFYEWLLEDSDESPVYELHDKSASPTVWGMGDVSYHIDLQLKKMDTGSSPKILILDYKPPKESSTPKVVNIDFFTKDTLPPRLKAVAKEQGIQFGSDLIVVKTKSGLLPSYEFVSVGTSPEDIQIFMKKLAEEDGVILQR